MSVDELIQAKMYRLEELKKYQSYYGPITPYPVVVEINDLETELKQLLRPAKTHSSQVVKKKVVKKKKDKVPFWQIWRQSQATFDAIITIAFFGFIFLLATIVFAAYVKTRPHHSQTTLAYVNPGDPLVPTLRPTFTPTSDPNSALVTAPEGAVDGATYLPTPGESATEVPTPVPTLTPSATPPPTDTPPPVDTPVPTEEPPPAQPVAAPPAAALPAAPDPPPADLPAAAPAAIAPTSEPTPVPEPGFPFIAAEQGNREFQHTNYHVITIYVAAVSAGNIPIGGLKVIGDHVPSGMHAESGLSDWNWSAINCLDCDYIKQGNVKFEPGTFSDGIWNIYLADQNGTPLSAPVSLSYSADPAQWVWDFIIFKRNS
ncbi:MAG TPA: hypothetical protein VEC96_05290 [Anaerolineae bacterium]|nr:hypothetical protein [Anaerolineae bacterium]